MEMYNHKINSFETFGTKDKTLLSDHLENMKNYFLRSIHSFGFAALYLGNLEIAEEARFLDKKFM